MALPRKKFRELIFQLLHSVDSTATEAEKVSFFQHLLKTTNKNIKDAMNYTNLILDKKRFIDEKITKISISYDFNRITSVELTILRLSIFEILFDENICKKIIISEAIRLSKKFANHQSFSYINAILDNNEIFS